MEYRQDKLITVIEEIIALNENEEIHLKLEKLLNINERKEKRLNRIILQNDRNQSIRLNKTRRLYELSQSLEKKVQEEIDKAQSKDKMLMDSSKQASMGQMMDAVAHQWKQPVSIISMHIELLSNDFDDGLVDRCYINVFQDDVSQQVEHMFATLKEFRNFLRPSTKNIGFNIQSAISKALSLVKDEFMQYSIEVKVEIEQNFKIDGAENEIIHLILNIINNAKDALNENNIQKKLIKIKVSQNEVGRFLEISDNARGVPIDIIDDIFKANVTTKETGKGTGIGLYMSAQIALKLKAKLSVENIQDGAKFTLSLNNDVSTVSS